MSQLERGPVVPGWLGKLGQESVRESHMGDEKGDFIAAIYRRVVPSARGVQC